MIDGPWWKCRSGDTCRADQAWRCGWTELTGKAVEETGEASEETAEATAAVTGEPASLDDEEEPEEKKGE